MFWSIFAGQFGFGQFWQEKVVLVDFGQKKWFLLIWTENLCFDQKSLIWLILTEKTGLVDFDWKNWFYIEQTVFGQFWPKKWFVSILTENTGF